MDEKHKDNIIMKCKNNREKELNKFIKKLDKRIQKACKKGYLSTDYYSHLCVKYKKELHKYFSEWGFLVEFSNADNNDSSWIRLKWEHMI